MPPEGLPAGLRAPFASARLVAGLRGLGREAEEPDLGLEVNAIRLPHRVADVPHHGEHVGGRRIPLVHDEVRVHVRHSRAAHAIALEAAFLDQAAEPVNAPVRNFISVASSCVSLYYTTLLPCPLLRGQVTAAGYSQAALLQFSAVEGWRRNARGSSK